MPSGYPFAAWLSGQAYTVVIRENDNAPVGDAVVLALPSDSTAPGKARTSVRENLTRWRLPDKVDACVLAVSELVTNALRHGSPPIVMRLRRQPHDVRMDVSDGDTGGMPDRAAQEQADTEESGRGLFIVRSVADEVGVETSVGNGKSVYASWHV